MAVKTFRYSLLSNLQENLCKLKKTRASNSVNVLRIDPCQQLISNLMKHYSHIREGRFAIVIPCGFFIRSILSKNLKVEINKNS